MLFDDRRIHEYRRNPNQNVWLHHARTIFYSEVRARPYAPDGPVFNSQMMELGKKMELATQLLTFPAVVL